MNTILPRIGVSSRLTPLISLSRRRASEHERTGREPRESGRLKSANPIYLAHRETGDTADTVRFPFLSHSVGAPVGAVSGNPRFVSHQGGETPRFISLTTTGAFAGGEPA